MTTKPIGLYVHIPFCKRKCNYCDFCSFDRVDGGKREEYINALLSDIESYRGLGVSLNSVFFGGGTPSLLSPIEFERIFKKIEEVFEILPNSEITVEANPATLDLEKLLKYKSLGVNRISLGLQSIHENELKFLGRIHSYGDFLKTYELCRSVGFDNINVDLMYAYPTQTKESLSQTLDAVCSLSPEHISLYSLILEEGTPLYDKRESLIFPSEDTEGEMYALITDKLSQNGYLHYEISNYAKAGRESRHNLKYWRDEEYIGVGIASYSYFHGERYGKTDDMSAYISSPSESLYKEKIDTKAEKEEFIMLALRLSEGISLTEYKRRFDEDFLLGRQDRLSNYERLGLVRITSDRVCLTERGFYVSNTIISSLM